MTETVLVEDSVQVASEYLPVGADTTVQLSRAKGSEGFGVIEIRGFTNMNLIPGNSAVRQRLTEEPVTTDAAGAEAGHLLCLHRSADREQAKPRHAAVLLDPERVEELLAKHLHPAADTHHEAKPGVVANRLTEATLAQGKLSAESPVAKALLGHAPGDSIEVQTPRGPRRFRVQGLVS